MLAFGKNEGEFFYDEKTAYLIPAFCHDKWGKALLSK
jgi:hypothetical protein